MMKTNERFDGQANHSASKKVHLKKALGQYILKDRSFIERIVSAVPQGKLIVEIGPGAGALTEELLNRGHRLKAVELDQEMVSKLKQMFNHRRDFRLITGNILKVNWDEITKDNADDIVVVGNLPYHLASQILFNIFKLVRRNHVNITEMVVMLQREVGQRLTAEPGSRNAGSLALLTRYHGTPEYLFTVPAASFHPVPRVDGAVIRMTFHQPHEMPGVDYEAFRRVVRGCFAQRRKMMRNALGVIGNLPDGWQNLAYDFKLRPEQFNLMEFVNLTRDLLELQEEKH